VRVITAEVDIAPQEIVSGRADAILSDKKDLYVLDIKSMNSMVFKNLEEAKEENINQLQLYLHFFKVPKGILLYVNKDTQELKEFLVSYNPKIAENLLKDLADLKTKIDSNVIPARILAYPDDWQCKYCAFREICGMANGGEMDWGKFKTKIDIATQNS
jgi:CRISPR/Cas system-associated exonuclease Cas4 (RecB family)